MANVTDLGFDMEQLRLAVVAGDVRSQSHPEYPQLKIFNYTEEVQYRNKWNNITLACRGLILNIDTGEIVARPWEKFFNLGQRDNTFAWDAPVEVTDKMDGSLGILYELPDGDWAIATRGSFASEQAIHATSLLHTKYFEFVSNLDFYYPEGVPTTLLFEIIYPDNRIVVNYGETDDLVLLGGVDKQRGYYYGPTEVNALYSWTGPVTEVFEYKTFAEAISAPDRKGMEGYVIRSGRNIVKLKQADYIELHRIVTNLSPKTIWEMMGVGKTVDEICADIPDEFHSYVTDIGSDLLNQAAEIMSDAHIMYDGIISKLNHENPGWVRKDFAILAGKSIYKKYMFLLLDNKPIKNVVWDSIKPRGDIKSLVDNA